MTEEKLPKKFFCGHNWKKERYYMQLRITPLIILSWSWLVNRWAHSDQTPPSTLPSTPPSQKFKTFNLVPKPSLNQMGLIRKATICTFSGHHYGLFRSLKVKLIVNIERDDLIPLQTYDTHSMHWQFNKRCQDEVQINITSQVCKSPRQCIINHTKTSPGVSEKN